MRVMLFSFALFFFFSHLLPLVSRISIPNLSAQFFPFSQLPSLFLAVAFPSSFLSVLVGPLYLFETREGEKKSDMNASDIKIEAKAQLKAMIKSLLPRI
ncbi:hypothetical protein V8C44DRAFT_336544 [Trichoderma aethiopicum]